MMKVITIFSVTFLAVALAGVQASGAIAFNLNLLQVNSGGARFSFLHTAGTGTGTGRAASGTIVKIGGDQLNLLKGSYDTSSEVLTILGTMPSPINHDELKRGSTTVIAADSFRITGGKFLVTDITGGGSGAFDGGYLSYEILSSSSSTTILDSGNLYFASKNEGSATGDPDGTTPNSGVFFNGSTPLSVTIDIAEWGNNWTHSGENDWSFLVALGAPGVDPITGLDLAHASSDTYRLGMDLRASGSVIPTVPTDIVPEPMSAVVWVGLGLCFSMIGSRRRRCSGSSRA